MMMSADLDRTALRRRWWSMGRYWLWREWKTRYAGSSLGWLWLLMQPLVTLVVFYVLFGRILAIRVPGLETDHGYLLHLMAGLAVWLPFADAVGRGVGSLVAYEDFLRKQPVPAEILPAISVGGAMPTLALGYLALLGVAWAQGPGVRWSWAWLPMVVLAQVVMTLGVTWLLSMAHFLWRDVGSALPSVLQLLFYLTPIVYPLAEVPQSFHGWYLLNPLACLVMGLQAAVFGLSLSPHWWLALGLWTALLGAGGWWFFRNMKPTLGEAL